MGQLLQVEGNTSLVRDVSSNAIVNTNVASYNDYLKNKEIALSRKNQIERQNSDINMLKQDMAEIKEMLTMLIKGKE
jgi:hypothetical protein